MTSQRRLAAGLVTGASGLLAVVLPLLSAGPLVAVQVMVGVAALACWASASCGGPGLSGALACLVTTLALTSDGDALRLVTIPLAGATALGATEGARLCALWAEGTAKRWTAERLEVRAALRRSAIAGAVGLGMSATGVVDVQRSGLLVMAGLLAAAVLIWLTLRKVA